MGQPLKYEVCDFMHSIITWVVMGYKEEFVKELGGYGLTNERIDRVLDVLRIVYISQGNIWNDGFNFSPYGSDKFKSSSGGETTFYAEKEIEILYSSGIIDTHPTHYPKLYICSKRGNKVGHELVEECIQINRNEIRSFLDKYPNKLIGYVLTSFKEITKVSLKGESIVDIPRGYYMSYNHKLGVLSSATEDISEFCKRLNTFNLTEVCSAYISSGFISFYIFPPEIIDYIKNYNDEIKLEIERYTIKHILFSFSCSVSDYRYAGVIPNRSKFVKLLSENKIPEIKIQNIIDEAHGYDLTSKYNMKTDKTPFFVLNKDGFKKFLDTKIPLPIIDKSEVSKKWWHFWS